MLERERERGVGGSVRDRERERNGRRPLPHLPERERGPLPMLETE